MSSEPPSLRVSYLCLEQSKAGSAAYSHLHGFFAGWPAESLSISAAAHGSGDSARVKLISLARAYSNFIRSFSCANIVGARVHPLVFPAILLAKAFRKRTFLFVQGRPDDLPKSSIVYRSVAIIARWNFVLAMKMVDTVFATSDGLAEWAASITEAPVVQVRNGVDLGRFPKSAALRSGAVFVGTPAPWQGLDTLLRAAASTIWPADVKLTLVGVSPEDVPGVVEGPVEFAGRLSPDEVARLLNSSAIGITPKRLDNATRMGVSPFKLAEYHGAGVAIVATDVPGQREMIEASRGGLLFSSDDHVGLADAVRRLTAEPMFAEQLRSNARAYAEHVLSWEMQRSRVVGALKQLL